VGGGLWPGKTKQKRRKTNRRGGPEKESKWISIRASTGGRGVETIGTDNKFMRSTVNQTREKKEKKTATMYTYAKNH